MEDLQKVENKLLRLLNNTRISDKINTKSFAHDLNMLSLNQINAQVKLTEMWKASNVQDYPTKLVKKAPNSENMLTRSTVRGDLVPQGVSCLTPPLSWMHPKSGIVHPKQLRNAT